MANADWDRAKVPTNAAPMASETGLMVLFMMLSLLVELRLRAGKPASWTFPWASR